MKPGPRRAVLIAAASLMAIVAALLSRAMNSGLDGTPLPRPEVNAPFVRTPDEIVEQMLKLADPQADEVLYDLGCGDGRIVIRAAESFGCRAVGYDIDPARVTEARDNVERHGVADRVTIVEQDIFTLDLSEADVVTLYLLPRLNAKLIPQLKRLKPGARVVSHDFDLPGVTPARTIRLTAPDGETVGALYLWIAPLREATPGIPERAS